MSNDRARLQFINEKIDDLMSFRDQFGTIVALPENIMFLLKSFVCDE